MPKRLKTILFYGILFLGLYFVPNWLSYPRASFLPMFELEKQIPFLPDSIWIYLSLYAYIGIAALQERDERKLDSFLKAMLITMTLSAAFFMIYPSQYPRPAELPMAFLPGSNLALRIAYLLDRPANCFPSLHISSCLMCFYLMKLSRPKWSMPSLIWFLLIAISTLTLKQHYFIDIIGGMVLGTAGVIVFLKIHNRNY